MSKILPFSKSVIALIFCSLLCFTLHMPRAKAQSANVEFNNVKAFVHSDGTLFQDLFNTAPGFEIPAGGGVHTIFSSGLWIGGKDQQEQLYTAAGMFGNELDFFSGPLTNDGTASTTSDQVMAYDRVWIANKADVDQHIAYFEAAVNGTLATEFPNGYEIPQWMFDWPAHGNIALSQDFYLAPFIDYNLNNAYDPENGDYPNFPGDICAYVIMNDAYQPHALSEGFIMGLEIHAMVYGFQTNDNLNNAVFVKYKIKNQSTRTYTDTHLGMWTDIDLGNGNDDYIGCDVQHAAYYGYNGDDFDEASAVSAGYGSETPVQSVVFLGGPLADADGMDNSLPAELESYDTYGPFGLGHGDGIIDNEQVGMNSFVAYNNSGNPVNGEPSTAPGFMNYLQGGWANGSAILYGGNGVLGVDPNNVEVNYMYPGESDPAHYDTDGLELPLWTELTAGNATGDRRGIAGSGPFTLEPGEIVFFDVCFLAVEETGTGLGELELLAEAIEDVQGFFASGMLWEQDPNGTQTTSVTSLDKKQNVRIYPNPASDMIRYLGPSGTTSMIDIFDMTGKVVLSTQAIRNDQIDVSSLPAGVYQVRMSTTDGVETISLMKK